MNLVINFAIKIDIKQLYKMVYSGIEAKRAKYNPAYDIFWNDTELLANSNMIVLETKYIIGNV